MKTITDDTIVGYTNDGGEIKAENLCRWVYHQLDMDTEMYEALRRSTSVLKGWYYNEELVTQWESILAKAEGK